MSEAQVEPTSPDWRHEVTDAKRARVRELSKIGTQEEVADRMGFSVDTLQRHYIKEWREGHSESTMAIKARLLQAAMGINGAPGSVNAMWKFLTLMGAIPRQSLALTGPGGGPIEAVDLTKLTAEQLTEYGRLAAIAQGLDPDGIVFELTDAPARPAE